MVEAGLPDRPRSVMLHCSIPKISIMRLATKCSLQFSVASERLWWCWGTLPDYSHVLDLWRAGLLSGSLAHKLYLFFKAHFAFATLRELVRVNEFVRAYSSSVANS